MSKQVCVINEMGRSEFSKEFVKKVDKYGDGNEEIHFSVYVDQWGDVHYVGYIVYEVER